MSGGELDLDALEALLDAATPGPWQVHDHVIVETTWGGLHLDIAGTSFSDSDTHSSQDRVNAALIAALRNALPALIAAARERDTAVGQAQTLLKSARLSADQAQRHRVERDAARAETAALRERVEALADQFDGLKSHALSDRDLRVTAKYAVPKVINQHVTVHVLAKVADDLRAALTTKADQ